MGGVKIRTLFIIIYFIISVKINISFQYENSIQLIIGSIVSTMIATLIDLVIFRKAYTMAGDIKAIADLDGNQTSKVHWFLRAIFIAAFYLFSKTEMSKSFITCLTLLIYSYFIDEFHMVLNSLLN